MEQSDYLAAILDGGLRGKDSPTAPAFATGVSEAEIALVKRQSEFNPENELTLPVDVSGQALAVCPVEAKRRTQEKWGDASCKSRGRIHSWS